MNFTPLASSSSGNAYLLEDGDSRILIECGLPYRRLRKLAGDRLAGLSGCLLSHEHKDHARCHLDLLKNGVMVYASGGTAQALGCDLLTPLKPWEQRRVGSFEIKPFPTFHDAAEPFGFLVRSLADGEKLLFATDTVNLGWRVPGLTLIALECNYQEEILDRVTRMPPKVVKRIRNSHMEVKRACDYLRSLDLSGCRQVYLLHLSDACSNEGLFAGMAREACRGVPVAVCPKEWETE